MNSSFVSINWFFPKSLYGSCVKLSNDGASSSQSGGNDWYDADEVENEVEDVWLLCDELLEAVEDVEGDAGSVLCSNGRLEEGSSTVAWDAN